jgi:cytochrome c-type biogenesis protein CcmH
VIPRRAFLAGLGGAVLAGSMRAQQAPSGQEETGALRDPDAAGRPHDRITARDNEEFITAVEKRMHCTCGCGLDIYTCRTTDFTCSFSPALHQEVLALNDEGKSADEIVSTFVAKYGEKVLMAPKPVGFNIAGYIVPGLVILLVGGVMFAILKHRTRVLAVARAETPTAPPMPPGASRAVVGAPPASQAELDRLARELQEFDQ